MSKIVLKVGKKRSSYQAIAEIYSDKGTLIEGQFLLNGAFLNADSAAVGGRGFAKLASSKVQDAQSGDVFTIEVTNLTSGVLTCSVSVSQGMNTCQ